MFDHVREQTSLQDIIEKKIIKEVRTKRIAPGVLQNTIVASCVDCFYFQLLLLSIINHISNFDTINCRFVTSDCFSFGDGFDDDIYVGNSQLLKITSLTVK